MSLPNQLIIRAANLDDVESIITFSAAMALETENRQLDLARLGNSAEELNQQFGVDAPLFARRYPPAVSPAVSPPR